MTTPSTPQRGPSQQYSYAPAREWHSIIVLLDCTVLLLLWTMRGVLRQVLRFQLDRVVEPHLGMGMPPVKMVGHAATKSVVERILPGPFRRRRLTSRLTSGITL